MSDPVSTDRVAVELVIAPPRPEGYSPRGPVSMEWIDRDWRCKYCDRERSAGEPIWTWAPLGRGCTTCALRVGALVIDWGAASLKLVAAAPDMLAVLESVYVDLVTYSKRLSGSYDTGAIALGSCADQVAAVIKRAKGQG